MDQLEIQVLISGPSEVSQVGQGLVQSKEVGIREKETPLLALMMFLGTAMQEAL